MSEQLSMLDILAPPAPPDPLDLLLATPADRTVWDNLPEGVTEEFLMGRLIAVDSSGPVPSLQGTTLACWQHIRAVLEIAWLGRPRRELPRICKMGLPWINRERRQRINALAAKWPREIAP